ncbi:MAG TPA: biopolymer transporter ExbD, partial [Marinobacter adhaerens]|nr:biopolymer transporter ExbD [Marinobacter adhaerens]
MKTSRKAKRIRRHYGRMKKSGGLNLVSLMDIFTILVFFLMV